MSKKKKNNPQKPEVDKQSSYYELKTKAVDDLVNADESNSPEVSREELRKYQSGPKLRVADWVKLLFIKAWFAGAVCFFFFWGLSTYMADQLDLLFVTGFALGTATDLLTNPVLRFFEKSPGDNSRWMMFPKKGFATLIWNILYGYLILFLVYSLYTVINTTIAQITGAVDNVALGVEPILFGLFCLGFDLLLIKAKHMFINIFRGYVKKPSK